MNGLRRFTEAQKRKSDVPLVQISEQSVKL